jgi:hypothetical protein
MRRVAVNGHRIVSLDERLSRRVETRLIDVLKDTVQHDRPIFG